MLINVNLCIAEEIVIFGNDNKPPKYFLKNNEPRGILIETMKYLDSNLPQSFEYKLYPWKRAYSNALYGKGGIIGLSKNDKRLLIFDYSDVIYHDIILLVVLKRNDFQYHNINDLKGKKVGYIRGASFGQEFERGKNSIFSFEEDSSPKQRLLKLFHKRIDVALIGAGIAGFNQTLEQDKRLLRNKDQFVILPKPFIKDPNYLGFSKKMKMKGFLKQFNRVLKKGYKTGALQKIINEYKD
jgi:ABC-type amino acid transport substrate-binding protein